MKIGLCGGAGKLFRRILSSATFVAFTVAVLFYLLMVKTRLDSTAYPEVADTRFVELKNYCENKVFSDKKRTAFQISNCQMYWLMNLNKLKK